MRMNLNSGSVTQSTITRAALSPDGKTLAVCGKEVITTWDLATGKRETVLKGHKGQVNSIAFSIDGGMILAGSFGPQVKLWRLSTGTPKFVTDDFIGAHNVAVCPDGTMMASAGGGKPPTIHLFDSNGKQIAVLKGHEQFIQQIAFVPAPVADSLPAPIRKTDSTADPKKTSKDSDQPQATRTYKTLASVSDDHSVKMWDLEKRKLIATLKGHASAVHCVAPSPDGKILATGSSDGTIRLWDTSLDKKAVVLRGRSGTRDTSFVISVAFSPDGTLLAAAEMAATRCVRVWDVKTSKQVAVVPGVNDDFRTVLFTPDGKQLIGCVYDGTVRVWNVAKLIAGEK
jgi:WD40 repeat protein